MKKQSIEKYLELEDDLRRYRKALNQAQEVMLDQEVTAYPIFIFHQQELEMGVPIILASEQTGVWAIHASSLEEFMVKNLIDAEKIPDFQKLFKEHNHHFCLFVLFWFGLFVVVFVSPEEK